MPGPPEGGHYRKAARGHYRKAARGHYRKAARGHYRKAARGRYRKAARHSSDSVLTSAAGVAPSCTTTR